MSKHPKLYYLPSLAFEYAWGMFLAELESLEVPFCDNGDAITIESGREKLVWDWYTQYYLGVIDYASV